MLMVMNYDRKYLVEYLQMFLGDSLRELSEEYLSSFFEEIV